MESLISWLSILIAIGTTIAYRGHRAGTREYCDWETFNATCAADETIVIGTAKYGRMALGRCVIRNYGHIGCGTDVTSHFDQTCSGRESCQIRVISLHAKRSCPKDFKMYLEASYKCLQVAMPLNRTCPASGSMSLTARQGSISSGSAYTTSLGFADCPWTVRAETHQKINFTMLDFFVSPTKTQWHGPNARFYAECHEYVVISEPTIGINRTICGGRSRDRVVYVSRTNFVRFHVVKSATEARFLVHYKAVGCHPLALGPHMYLTMTDEHAVVKCNGSSQTWYLTCRDTGWIGHVGNCSPAIIAASQNDHWTLTGVFQKSSTFPFGILIVVAIGIAIGVAIGVSMLVIVMTYMKRRRRRKIRSRSNYVLKQLSLLDDDEGGKETDALPDRAPMSMKRCRIDSDRAHQKYLSTVEMRGRPLPTPGLLPLTSAVTAAPEEDVILCPADVRCVAVRRAAQRPTSSFSTFKPHSGATGSTYSPGRTAGRVAPFYFQLDPEATPNPQSYRPDIFDGYSSCRAKT